MGRRFLAGAVAVATVFLATPGWAGGAGGHGGGFHFAGGHPAMGGPRGYGGGAWRGGMRAMPPIAGVIHERPGMRPTYSGYGHLNTGYSPGRGAWPVGSRGYTPGGFGHVATGYPGEGAGRYGRMRTAGSWQHERFADGRRISLYRFGRGYARTTGYGGGSFGGGGGFSDGSEPDAGGYGSPGTYGAPGTYGTPGTYGRYGTQSGDGGAYLSEPPLAATHAEAPLAPSPYGPDGGYYAPRRSGVAPHILTVDRSSDAGCGCGSAQSAYPAIYRYGVGTAY